jgi:CzcA family heavy metal efflux pump
MKLAEAAISQRRAILLIIFILMAAGLYSAFRLPSGIYPELNFPRIVIIAEAGDLSTGNMLLGVTRPLEQSVSGAQGLNRIRSRTIRGETEISLIFLPHSDMQLALQQVQAKVSEARTLLPAQTELTVERITAAVFPVLIFHLWGSGVPPADLRDYAQYTVRPVLSRIPGVGQVGVLGDTVREIEVVVDVQKLLANHLTLDDVSEAIRKANIIEAVGRMDKDYKRHLLLMSSEIHAEDSIRNIILADRKNDTGPSSILYLRDIATVFEGSQDKLMLISGNGKPSAQINVTRQINGNILNIQKEALSEMQNLKRDLPPNVSIMKVYDLAEFVRESIGSVRDAILIGCFLSMIILLFFLREWRSTLIAACSIPATLLITLFFMKQFGQTLNLMSLGGMAVAIGLVIDDAIVVVENIHRHIQLHAKTGESVEKAIRRGTNEILGAVAGSTFTTVVVFLPLGLVEGAVGQFFLAFSETLSIAVLVSLVLAFSLIPILSRRYLQKEGREPAHPERFIEALSYRYESLLRRALRHTNLVLICTILFAGIGIFVYTTLGSGFLPLMDEGSFVIDYFMPAGTSLTETDRVLHEVERILQQTPEVAGVSRRTGSELGLFATAQNEGDILVRLKKARHRGVEEIMDEVREKVESTLPGIRIEFVQILQDFLGDLEGNPNPVEIKIFGDDLNVLQNRAEEISQKVEKIDGVVDLFNGIQKGNPEILVQIDPTRTQNAGLDPESVKNQLAEALLGQVVTQYRQFDRLIGIRVRFPDSARFNYELVRKFPLLNQATGTIVPLSSIATLKEVEGSSELLRENQRQMIDITARISGTTLGDVIPKVKKIMQETSMPIGYTWEIGGLYQSQQNSFRQLLMVLFIAVMLVLILLVIQFRDLTSAFVILSAAPVSLVGAFLMLRITNTEFNVSSFMGLIMLIGLIVKNGIILIEYTFQLHGQENLTMTEALVRAGKTRLRPILMTTLATLFGLLPLALGLGAGSEMQKPLALAVIGGLSLSMLVTLIVVPVLLLKLKRDRFQSTN